jgi:hypothetical protein
LSEQTDHDLLIELRSEFKAFYEEFRRVSNGIGFPRCGERLERLKQLEEEAKVLHKRIDDIKSKFWWAFTVASTSILGLIITLLKGALEK